MVKATHADAAAAYEAALRLVPIDRDLARRVQRAAEVLAALAAENDPQHGKAPR